MEYNQLDVPCNNGGEEDAAQIPEIAPLNIKY